MEPQEKIDKLPLWVRQHIKCLEIRAKPAIEEAAKCRQRAEKAEAKAKRLSEANAALLELLSKAGQAGLDWADTVVRVLEGYEIFRSLNSEASNGD